ncbi:hypothetical protein IQ286_40430 [Burkholderia sp. R-69749]|nr:hypothetical protein [Burkholderia sp. R-69749]
MRGKRVRTTVPDAIAPRPLDRVNRQFKAARRNCVFRSDSHAEAHEHIAREFSDHVLNWKQGAPNAALFKGELNQLKVYSLSYGAQIEITPCPFDGFTLVHTSLSGECTALMAIFRRSSTCARGDSLPLDQAWNPLRETLRARHRTTIG